MDRTDHATTDTEDEHKDEATPETPERRSWRGVAAEDRVAERRALLLDAAFDLLGTEGWGATTVRGVCRAARLNPRYFYESFEDLDQLLLATFDRLVERISERAIAAVTEVDGDRRAKMRAGVASIARMLQDDRRIARVLYAEALGNPQLARRRIDTMHNLVRLIELTGYRDFGPPPPGEHIGAVAAHLAVGGLTELLVAWLDGQLPIDEEQFVDDVTDLLMATVAAAFDIARRRADR